jgi:hypothetical protein
MKEGNGNGHKAIAIKTGSPRPGYLVIRPGTKHRHVKGVPAFLAHALYKWCMEHPDCRVRSVVGSVEDGQTVLLQVWYDEGENKRAT